MILNCRTLFLAMLLAGAATPLGAQAPARPSQPTLINREEVLRVREYASRISLQPGDSLIINVWAMIDENGTPTWPEVKEEVKNEKAKQAALGLVRKMRFNPALLNGKPKKVLLKIPVKLVRPPE